MATNTSKKINILVTHFFSKKNNGDTAIMLVLLSQLNKIFGGAEILIVTSDPGTDKNSFGQVPEIESFFYLAVYTSKQTVLRALKSGYIISSTLVWAIFYRFFKIKLNFLVPKKAEKLLNSYLKATLVVASGGGYIIGGKGIRANATVILQLHGILIASLLKKPVMLYSQSIGPFYGKLQSNLARLVLNSCRTILCRENITIQTLKQIGVRHNLIIKTADPGFLYSSDTKNKMGYFLKNLGIDGTKILFGVTVLNWFKDERQFKFEKEIACFAERLASRDDLNVIFIPQVTAILQNDDDRETGRRIKGKINLKPNIWFLENDFNLPDIKGIYENLDFLAGTRMHSNIFSLSSLVPVIAIEYQYKTRGIMEDLGLGQWVMKIEDVSGPGLCQMSKKLLGNRGKYLEILKQQLPAYKKRAEAAELILKSSI